MMPAKLPRWKQWILLHVIGDFDAFNMDLRTYRSDRFTTVRVRAGHPGAHNTAQLDPASVEDPYARHRYYEDHPRSAP